MKLTAMPTLCVDVFDETGKICPGGEALNFAVHASAYDNIDVSLIGAIGDDLYGKVILESIAGKKINKSCIHIVENEITANNRIYLTQQGDRYFKDDSWTGGIYAKYRLGDADLDLIQQSDVVFLTYYCPYFKQIIELKKKYGFLLAVDFDVERDFERLEPYCKDIDFFMSSGSEEYLPVFRKFSLKYKGLFNMTLAERGSVTYCQGLEYRVKAVPVDRVIDTTGCGDSYHAGFVCSYLRDRDIITAMNEGSEIAAYTLSHYGGY